MVPEQSRTRLTRRGVLGAGAALSAGTVAAVGFGTPAAAGDRGGLGAFSPREGLRFLQGVVDAYARSGPRLAQSYCDTSGLSDIAFVYDNALAAIALLVCGDETRSRAVGDALVYAQEHDEKFRDGRLRQAYHADSFRNPDGTAHFGWEFGLTGSAVGDQCWAGIALAQLARRTRRTVYREAAVKIANWVLGTAYSTTGLQGYTFGATAGLEKHKSSEHNIDVAAFFAMIAELTDDRRWQRRADHGWAFVEKMWNAEQSRFWTGSDDGSTVNTKASQVPLDVQTWAWLAARQSRYAAALDWAGTDLATTDTPSRLNSALPAGLKIHGVGFATGSLTADPTVPIDQWNPKPDSGAVWLEGNAQLALALRDRGRSGDAAAARALLDEIGLAQRKLGRGQRFGGRVVEGGVVAASSPLHTGFGFGYYPNLHVGATAWSVFAATRTNPYRFLRR